MPSHAFSCKSFVAKSHRHLRSVAANRSSPINPLEQHRKLCLAERYCSACRLRPDESSTLQSLREQTQAIARPPQQLDQIPTTTTKHEYVTREGVFLEYVLHHPAQPGKSSPQIGHSCCNPDARSCRQPDHQTRLSITARSAITSTAPKTRSVPFGSLISMVPGCAMKPLLFTLSPRCSLATLTGRKLVVVPNRPS